VKGHQAARLRRNSARKVKGAKTAKAIFECGDSALAVNVHGQSIRIKFQRFSSQPFLMPSFRPPPSCAKRTVATPL
jgi:hypothetical protein